MDDDRVGHIFKILETKNQVLRKFAEVSREMLAAVRAGEFASLPTFEQKRDHFIKAIELYDQRVEEEASQFRGVPSEDVRARLIDLLDEKDKIVIGILAIDDEVLKLITAEQAKIQKDIVAERKARDMLAKFKSGLSEAGEGLDQKL